MINQLQSEKEILEDKIELFASELSEIKAQLKQSIIAPQNEGGARHETGCSSSGKEYL